MASLDRAHRKQLENAVKQARRAAQAGALQAIELLAVANHEPWPTLTPEQRTLRNRLRAHGRQLGDREGERRGVQGSERLVAECAYEHWHRLLFARFLAENDLLIEPSSGMPLSLDECRELARERGSDWLALASEFAERMLPQIFRPDDPVLEITLPPETRQALEQTLAALPREIFLADDSLGWVYQYWQAETKDAINASETKIGATELPAVTQLFTEDYMVLFLLENTLGSWWAARHLAAHPELAESAESEDALRAACSPPGIAWRYLRFTRAEGEPWRPAAGAFDGWPKTAAELRVLDPCMGSGHFLVFTLPILASFRRAEEGLSTAEAVRAVLRENLFGLELDARCTQIGAFNLALAAWRMAGHQPLPPLQLACSGLGINAKKDDWLALAGDDIRLRTGMERLHRLFEDAPTLGSLINPRSQSQNRLLLEADFNELEPLLGRALADEKADDADYELAVTAQGIAQAAKILAGEFTLVATNVPYVGRGKQDVVLKGYCERVHPAAKADLATCFVERCVKFCHPAGTTALVSPQNWLFLGTYERLRRILLREVSWEMVLRLGAKAFQTPMWDFNTAFVLLTANQPSTEHRLVGLDASEPATTDEKSFSLVHGEIASSEQQAQLANPDARIAFGFDSGAARLERVAHAYQGMTTGDNPRFLEFFWEQLEAKDRWREAQSAGAGWTGGRELIVRWDNGAGALVQSLGQGIKGRPIWGKRGVAVGQMSGLPRSLYLGTVYDMTCSVLVPHDAYDLAALWSYCSSEEFLRDVRGIDQKLNVTNATLVKVPFDLPRWKAIAAERYPHGVPKPHSNDPTQWLFNGHPKGSNHPLQVAVARLVGYRWPRQTGSNFPDCPALGPDGLEAHADRDGIVCLSPLRGEASGADRLRALLAQAYGEDWSSTRLNELLSATEFAGKTVEEWLRGGFFAQHCAIFHQRPFVWQIWDGQSNGFSALVNYHRLAGSNGEGKRTLEKLLYSYLGDWIGRQRADQTAGVEGADARLAAAEHLKRELTKILEGEPPYDLFVRWKPLHRQASGWEPDLDDGVRLNIRPFLAAKPLGARARNACILRAAPNCRFDKDRGNEPSRSREEFPWFWSWDQETADFAGNSTFDGKRWNDLHYTRAAKQAARDLMKTEGAT